MAKREEAAEIAGVRVTHPDRVLFEGQGVTKRSLAEYYVAIADRILPHLAGRPLSLVRCPAGQTGECFFQKHASPGFPAAFKPVRITEKSGTDEYLYIDAAAGLVSAVQMGVLELHVWGSHVDTLEMPDRIVFDFDPDEAIDFGMVRAAAIEMREALAELKLESFPMATGGKGIHVVVPLTPKSDWDAVKDFAEAMARLFAERKPERYLAKASKAERRGKIFVDYLRNGRGSTAISPFSSRARTGAPVAWPVSWASLGRLKNARPATVETALTMLKRQKSDPWDGYFGTKQSLPTV